MRRFTLLLISLLAIAGGSSLSDAQAASFKVVEELGATSDVYDIVSHKGDTLLATSGGLVVLREGSVKIVMTARHAMPGVRLRSLSVGPDGVWVAGVDGVVRVVRDDEGNYSVAQRLALRRVKAVIQWKGATWFATAGKGLFRLEDNQLEPVDLGRYRQHLSDMLVDSDDLWIATVGHGLLRLSAEGKVMQRLAVAHGLPSAIVWTLEPAKEGFLVGTANGLASVHERRLIKHAALAKQVSRLGIRDVRSITMDGEDVIVGIHTGSVYRLKSAKKGAETLLSGATELRVLHASSGSIWLGTRNGTRKKTPSGKAWTKVVAGGLPSADITSLAQCFGKTWVGTFRTGVASIDKQGRIRKHTRARRRWGMDARVNDLAVTKTRGKQRLWIATDRGLWWHDGKRFAPVLDQNAPGRDHVTALHVSDAGELWVASSRMLSRFANGNWKSWTGDEEVPILKLHAVHTDAKGRVWVGSLHGLLEFTPKTGTFVHHTVASRALPVDWVTAIVTLGDETVIGTYHGGLSWKSEGGFRIEREGAKGVPAGWVNPHAMQVSGNALWVGTLDRGLVIGRSGKWDTMTVADGLPSNDVTDFLAVGPRMWVATRGGLALVERN